MKKAISLTICLIVCLSLLASCAGNGNTNTSSSTTPDQTQGDQSVDTTQAQPQSKSSPWANPDGSVNFDEVAYYDPDYDYSQNETYKCKFIVQEPPSVIHEDMDKAFVHWCPMMNMQYDGMVSSNNDPDLYLSLLQNHIDQGYRGFIIHTDIVLMPTVRDIMNDNPDCAWITVMTPPRFVDSSDPDDPGVLIHPWVGFDFSVMGEMFAEKLIEWRNEAIPDVPWEEIGFLNLDVSFIPPLHQRVISASQRLIKEGLPEANVFVADTAAYSFSIDGAIQAATPIVTTNDQFKYWMVNALMDDFAMAAATVIDSVGLTDTTCIVDMGGPGFIAQSDAGQQNAWRYVMASPELVQAEVFLGGIYAMLNGWATPDNLWPMWIDRNDSGGPGKTYANMRLPAYWLDFDSYKAFYQWSAVYAEADEYNYGVPGITRDSWPNRAEVPPEYNQ